MPEALSAQSPAKINLVLEVTGRREDGYHEVDTILQTLELAGQVRLIKGSGVTVDGPFAAGVPADESNLAWRAAAALAEITGHSLEGIGIALTKRVPPAAGLGGGASDAATTLRLLQRLWPATTDAQLFAAATSTGSDVHFFLHGGTARARGTGERVTPLPPLARHGIVLFVPEASIPDKTGRMFAALDFLPFDDGSVAAAFAASPPAAVSGVDIYNTFERVAFDLFPGLAGLWEQLEALMSEPVRLSGAGPTLFWIGPEGRAAAVAEAAAGLLCTVIPTATAGSLWKP